MIKYLTKHGNSLALLIERPILDLLKIPANAPLEITTDGERLTVARAATKRSKHGRKVSIKQKPNRAR